MELKVLKEEKNILELEIKGEDHTLANLLRGELWNTDGVELASYNLKHPIVSSPILSLNVNKGKPKKALEEALHSIKSKTKEFRSLLKKLN
ncbi:DNA-directed RNA polymerase subunit L [Candidatus Woesearchaeota archaeon]|nr:MAG: DNA-directed RNA polymerase subunit L [archaeon GW2011_AR18]MBS3162206.1 DNA-directed RNA polymerase subunit L [Candidatus Woesearchaeota archaeon]HIH26094.1 DNA-directed RNA polymerase subunit L [Nanoarchaeota archaeon]